MHRRTGERHPPLTSRRYDTWHGRVQDQHEWAAREEWGSHWLRRHGAALVGSWAGPDAKRVFLDHEGQETSDEYGKANYFHVAWAIAQISCEPHPDAQRPPWV